MGTFRVSVLLLLSVTWPGHAQTLFEFTTTIEAVRIDTLYPLMGKVLPGSIRVMIGQDTISSATWRFDVNRNAWSLQDSTYQGRSVRIQYKASPAFRLSPSLRQPYSWLPADTASLSLEKIRRDSLLQIERLRYQRADLFGDSNIQREGSIRRGIIIGSNRDAALESGLRLDLSGPISEQVFVVATLTDQSIPIQPEGSTQTLREFDKVYLSVKHPKVQLQLGDIDITVDSTAFTPLNRRLQGGDVRIQTNGYQQRLTASVARGTYRSQTLSGIDGVQGPYRLNGNLNETYIVVLAGSEKVYLDGVLLSRGEDQDYVIDYGLGEVTFTNKRWITEKSRITIDFQYLNQGYTRSLVSAESGVRGLSKGRWDLWTHLVREADSDHPLSQWTLTSTDIQKLRLSGDDPQKALSSTAILLDGDPPTDQIRYQRVDTLVSGQAIKFYRVALKTDSPAYSVAFVRSSTGKGAYTRANSTTNGFTYRWVGEGLGEYDTLKTLTAPQSKEILSLQTRYHLNERSHLYSELAGSRWDRNRFSALDDQDNAGFAWKGGLQWASGTTERPTYQMDLHHQFIGKQFAFIDRSRPVDFDRTWNLTLASPSNEHLTQARVFWNPLPRSTVRMDLGGLQVRESKSRRVQLALHSEETDQLQVTYTFDAVDTQQPLPTSSGIWIRQQANTSHSWKRGAWVITPGMSYQQETRKQVQLTRDSLVAGSLLFHSLLPSLRFRALQKPTFWSWSGEYRVDFQPGKGQFLKESTTFAQNVGFQYEKSNVFSTEHYVGVRQMSYEATSERSIAAAQTRNLQINSHLRYRLFDSFVQGNWTYEVRSERKAQLQERYFEVGSELGSFIWDDLNRNGVQELDEFFPERIPGEGNFILQYLPGDRYIPITTLEASVRHTFQFNSLSSEKIPEFLRRLELNSRISLRESTTDFQRNVLLLRWRTFQGPNTQLGRWSTYHELRLPISEGKPGFRIIHDFNRSSNQSMLGLDKSRRDALQATFEYRFYERWFLDLTGRSSRYEQERENLRNRNVNMRAFQLEPELRVVWNKTVTSSLGNRWIAAEDVQPNSKAELSAWEINATTQYYFSQASRAYVQLSRRSNELTGQTTYFGLYELTEGGGAGVVWTGNLSLEHRVNEIIRVGLQYDLKSIEKSPMLQILKFNVTAIL